MIDQHEDARKLPETEYNNTIGVCVNLYHQ